MKYIAYDTFKDEYEFFETEAEAVRHCKYIIEEYYGNGIPEDMTHKIGYAKIVKSVVQRTIENWFEAGYSPEFDYECILTLTKKK